MRVYLRDGSAQTILRCATDRSWQTQLLDTWTVTQLDLLRQENVNRYQTEITTGGNKTIRRHYRFVRISSRLLLLEGRAKETEREIKLFHFINWSFVFPPQTPKCT